MWIQKQNKQKLVFLGNSITHARTGLRMQNQAWVRKLDHAYADPYLENLKTQKQIRTLKQEASNLTYTKYEKN